MKAISAEEELAWIAAGTAARREQLAGRAWELMARARWRALSSELRRRRLLSVLGPRLMQMGAESFDQEFALEVEANRDAARRHAMFLELAGERVIGALTAHGLRCAWLKGPALARAMHGPEGVRVSSDLDILVEAERLEQAVTLTQELGYSPPRDRVRARDGLPELHFALEYTVGELPPVELHWRVHWYEERFAAERLLPPSPAGPGWRPAAADELGALLLFYARDGFLDLRLACDIGAWWDRCATALVPGALDELAGAYPRLRPALLASAHAAERIVGAPSDEVLAAGGRLPLRALAAVRMANPAPSGRAAQLHADVGLTDMLLVPRGERAALLRRRVLVPRGVLQDFARLSEEPRARSPLGHAVSVLARTALALAHLAWSCARGERTGWPLPAAQRPDDAHPSDANRR